jgi:MOSC domain-containing protein YiiM
VLVRGPGKSLIRKAGVMAIVVASGEVRIGDAFTIASEPAGFVPLVAV